MKNQNINWKNSIYKVGSTLRVGFESFGRAILVPVTVIPLLALIGALGYAGQAIASAAGTYEGGVKIGVDAVKNIGMIAITNIDFLIAVGLAAGLAKSEKISAALSGLMAYAAIHFATALMIQVVYPEMLKTPKEFGLAIRFGVMSFQYSAFGGMIAGLIGFVIHKYTYKLKFPAWLSFFGGPRFSPVAATLVAWLIGMPLGILWIYISQGLKAVGSAWAYMDAGAPFLYGVANRLLLPFGLHQVLNYFLYYTEMGATWVDGNGNQINGIYSIALAKLAAGEFILAKDTWIVNGTFPTNIFSLPAAAFAMYFVIPKENRKIAGSAIISAALAAFLAGTTEPIEFTFLFASPLLYGIHTILTGLVYMTMYLANFSQVSTRGSGLITWIVVNGINMPNIERAWGIFVVGPFASLIYFSTFYFLILKLNLKTPGRDGKIAILTTKKNLIKTKNKELTKVAISDEYNDEFINNIISGVGGQENIKVMANCVTRLRVTVFDKTKVDRTLIEKTSPYGIQEIGDQYQIIYGPRVVNIATKVRNRLGIEE